MSVPAVSFATAASQIREAPGVEIPHSDGGRLLEQQFERLYAMVHRFLLHCVFDPELAEELTAQTFYKVAGAIHRVGGDEPRLRAWVLRIAANVYYTHFRRRVIRQALLGRYARRELPAALPPDSELENAEQGERVRAALLSLRPKLRSCLALRFYLELPYDEIARVLGCSAEAARARVSRGLREMRTRLGLAAPQ